MGTDTIPARADSTTILATWFNVVRSAINGDWLPRNSSGIVTAVAGNLGSATYPWLKLFMGAVSSVISFEDSSGTLQIKVGTNGGVVSINATTFKYAINGVTKFEVDTGGLVANSIGATQLAANAVTTAKILDGNVTPAKRSAAIANVSTTTSNTGIGTGISMPASFTGTGRPMLVTVSVGGNTNTNSIGDMAAVKFSASAFLRLYKNGVSIADILSSPSGIAVPFSGFTFLDLTGYVGAGTYDLRTNVGTAGPEQGAGTVTLYLTVLEL